MEEQYNPHSIEKNVQRYWENSQTFYINTQSGKDKFYCLSMFPYPSGRLHVGHVRNYAIGDAIARYQRMLGKNVLQPIGWDAFGLPAEGAAIKNNTQPAKWTYSNITEMKAQLQRLGFAFDWSRELATCSPDYYHWEQWFFTQLYNKGLVYKKFASVNWCPNDQTVLANEQVENGHCWRCDALVERRKLPQWFIKITDYAEELLTELDVLEGWPEQVKMMQRHWIGRSEGVEITFDVMGSNTLDSITVYTTRPDTLMGVTYLAIAPEHPLTTYIAQSNADVNAFVHSCRLHKVAEADMATLKKKGICTGLYARHPISGKAIPIWSANFVLMEYGSGAVMSVPAHDQRDWEFAQAYHLPITQVIDPGPSVTCNLAQAAITEKGLLINSTPFNGMHFEHAFAAISDWLMKHNKGKRKTNYRLRDWGVSRQRYWGAPIPMRYLEDGSEVTVPDTELPVVLPENVVMDGVTSPLKSDTQWMNVTHNGQPALKETDTFDTFVESSWYYARFCSPHYHQGMLDIQAAHYWLPVDQYIGGIEHACMHLLYARFFYKLLRDFGFVKNGEPFLRLLCQGMVLADAFYRIDEKGTKHWLSPHEIKMHRDDKGRLIKATYCKTGEKIQYAGMTKMSKSKNNGVDPQELIDTYGADTVRLYTLFAAPPEQNLEWSPSGVEGAYRFLKRFWRVTQTHLVKQFSNPSLQNRLTDAEKSLCQKMHMTIKKVTDDYGRRQTFNTAIAAIMELCNAVIKFNAVSQSALAVEREAIKTITLLLAPITPHICHVIWQNFDESCIIVDAAWPQAAKEFLEQKSRLFIIQVNGKVRARLEIPAHCSDEEIKKRAMSDDHVKKFIQNKMPQKIIIVAGKLVNIVIT